jgi:hypothetical protein
MALLRRLRLLVVCPPGELIVRNAISLGVVISGKRSGCCHSGSPQCEFRYQILGPVRHRPVYLGKEFGYLFSKFQRVCGLWGATPSGTSSSKHRLKTMDHGPVS